MTTRHEHKLEAERILARIDDPDGIDRSMEAAVPGITGRLTWLQRQAIYDGMTQLALVHAVLAAVPAFMEDGEEDEE